MTDQLTLQEKYAVGYLPIFAIAARLKTHTYTLESTLEKIGLMWRGPKGKWVHRYATKDAFKYGIVAKHKLVLRSGHTEMVEIWNQAKIEELIAAVKEDEQRAKTA
jgi:hypothetical protein